MTATSARAPAGSAACICAAVGSLSTSVTYLVLQVRHCTCTLVLFSGMTGMKNSVMYRRPARFR